MYPKTKLGYCSKCGKYGFISTHHKFKQKKWRRKLYGDLLDNQINLVPDLCNYCHSIADSNDTWTEQEFCKELDIPIKSKGGR